MFINKSPFKFIYEGCYTCWHHHHSPSSWSHPTCLTHALLLLHWVLENHHALYCQHTVKHLMSPILSQHDHRWGRETNVLVDEGEKHGIRKPIIKIVAYGYFWCLSKKWEKIWNQNLHIVKEINHKEIYSPKGSYMCSPKNIYMCHT